jgi:hypothetical protein
LVLNVGTYTRAIRAQIVFNHIYFSDLTDEEKNALVADAFYLKMIDHRNFSPRLIELLTSAEFHAIQEDATRETVTRVLDNPAELWSTPYRSHLSEDSRVLMRTVFFCGYFIEIDEIFAAFKRFARGAGLAMSESEAAGRFRHALRAIDGSILHLQHKTLSFSNPGVRDFLTRVILEDHLIESVVASVDRFDELENAWKFYAKHRDECRPFVTSEDIWPRALERLETRGRGSVAQRLRLALEMNWEIKSAALEEVGERILGTLEIKGVDTNDVFECRRLLGQVDLLADETAIKERYKRIVARGVADMLADQGEYMDLDEISSLTKALTECSSDEALIKTAAQRALEGLVGNIDDKLTDIGSTSELDSFEEDLFEAMRRCELPVDYSMREELRSRREILLDREAEKEDRYQPSETARPPREASDDEIKSLFGTLSQYRDE